MPDSFYRRVVNSERRWYCPRCGEPLYVTRLGRYRRRAVCSLRVCDALPQEWKEPYANALDPVGPPNAIPADDLGRVADARRRFARLVERWAGERRAPLPAPPGGG